MSQYFSTTSENGVTFVAFNRKDKDANTLAAPVLRELDALIDTLSNDSGVNGVVFIRQI